MGCLNLLSLDDLLFECIVQLLVKWMCVFEYIVQLLVKWMCEHWLLNITVSTCPSNDMLLEHTVKLLDDILFECDHQLLVTWRCEHWWLNNRLFQHA